MRFGKVRQGGTRNRKRPAGAKGTLCRGFSIAVTALVCPLCVAQARATEIGVTPPAILDFYGQTGLIEMPTARFAPDGQFAFSVSAMQAQDRYALQFQALPWLETTFRYARVDRYFTNHDLYDRSLSFKIRLLEESDYLPEVAVGVQDIIGTGAYGAEYLVASKQFGDFDFTGGIGWRRFGGLATFKNPFSYIIPSFGSVPRRNVSTGAPLLNQFFHGPNAGLFGGVSWRTPIDGLTFLLEASGDRYTVQSATGAVDIRTPINVALAYQPDDTFEISGGYLYGSMLGIMASARLDAFDSPPEPKLGPDPLPAAERTSEQRTDAVLSFLQTKTKFYDNWPGTTAVAALAGPATGTSAAYRKLKIESVETFQNSLLVDIAQNPADLVCANVQEFSDEARARGLKQVVFSSRSTSQVRFCDVAAKSGPRIEEPVEYASNGALEEIADASADAPPPAAPVPVEQASESALQAARKQILAAMETQVLDTYALSMTAQRIDIAVENDHYETDTQSIGRTLRVLMFYAPPSVEVFRIVVVTDNEPTNQVVLSRADVERILDSYGSASELLPLSQLGPAPLDDPLMNEYDLKDYPNFDYLFAPGYRHSLFDPDNPYRYQFYADVGGYANLTHNLTLLADFEVNVFGNIQDITRKSNSLLPHVRSDFAEYFKHGLNGLAALDANYFTHITDDVYFFGRAGILESMYAGIGGEVYWQPPHSRWALGAELYGVQQRGFDRRFDLLNYRVVTGHVSLYYDSPFYNLDFAIHAGRYLAGDYGATFQVTRRFANGIEIGAYATFTNVPFSVFGEGSFDKGFIIRIPLGDILPLHTQEVADMSFSPLTRDGGQRLDGEMTLHQLLQRSSEGDMLQNWEQVLYP